MGSIFSSYTQSTLEKGEECLYSTGASFVRSAPVVLFGVIVMISPLLFPPLFPTKLYSLGAIGLGIFTIITTLLSWNATELSITNRRVILKTGLLKRNISEIYLQRCEGVDVNQTFAERLMGFGSVCVRGVGTELPTAKFIETPMQFKRAFTQAMDKKLYGTPGDSPSAGTGENIPSDTQL